MEMENIHDADSIVRFGVEYRVTNKLM